MVYTSFVSNIWYMRRSYNSSKLIKKYATQNTIKRRQIMSTEINNTTTAQMSNINEFFNDEFGTIRTMVINDEP